MQIIRKDGSLALYITIIQKSVLYVLVSSYKVTKETKIMNNNKK